MTDQASQTPPGTGYAAAVLPVAPTTIVTDAAGLDAGPIGIPSADWPSGEARIIPGYAAMPEGTGPFPTILVVQEIFGVHEHIRDLCRRLAKKGYLAVAPELYVRQGDPGAIADFATIFSAIVSKVADGQVLADLDAAAAWAAANGGDPARLGITGFCWGGRIVWLYAAHSAGLKAAVAWYGKVVGPVTPLTPRHPVDVADRLRAPVLGLYGTADQSIPVDTVEQMRSATAAAAHPVEIVLYPDAPHAFNADCRPSYREGPARDGWERMLAWFADHGVA
jgi:carboxymethylenebutenolidase